MNIVISGATEFGQKLMAAAAISPSALVATLFTEAEKIMTVSKANYVPVDMGALRASGFVEPPELTAGGGSVTLGYGGPSAPYALYVHEDLTKHHPVGQAKYLEVPVRAAVQGMEAVLAQHERDVIVQTFQQGGKP